MTLKIDFTKPLKQSDRSRWGLSQIGDCERKLTLIDRPEYHPESLDAKTQRLFAFGNATEDVLKNELYERGYILYYHQREIEWGGRRGHIDGIIYWDMKDYLWECKSHNFRAFQKLVKQGVHQAYPQYYSQIQAYLTGSKLEKCFFTGMDKNNSTVYSEIIDYDPQESLRLWNKLQLLNRYADNGLIHPVPNWVSWHCNYCNYSKICKGVNNG